MGLECLLQIVKSHHPHLTHRAEHSKKMQTRKADYVHAYMGGIREIREIRDTATTTASPQVNTTCMCLSLIQKICRLAKSHLCMGRLCAWASRLIWLRHIATIASPQVIATWMCLSLIFSICSSYATWKEGQNLQIIDSREVCNVCIST